MKSFCILERALRLHPDFAAEQFWDPGKVPSLSLFPRLIRVPPRIFSPLIKPAVRLKEIIIAKCVAYLLRLTPVSNPTNYPFYGNCQHLKGASH